jgi:protein-tyrosine phosphatase
VLVRQRQEVQALPRRLTTERLAPTRIDRVLNWDACLNVRDLGGLRTKDGRTIRWGALVRSDLLCRLTEAGRRGPVEHGIRTVIDVRFPSEVAADWARYPFRDWQAVGDFDGLRYFNLPFHDETAAHHEALGRLHEAAKSRGGINILDLEYGRPGVAAIVAAIADARAGGVLVHCHGGKDRTGLVTAVVLSFLGVSDDDIADDYAMTMLNLEPVIIEWLDDQSSDPVERARLRKLATPSREAMLEALAHLAAVHGPAEAYLRAGGLTDDQLARLRSRLLD